MSSSRRTVILAALLLAACSDGGPADTAAPRASGQEAASADVDRIAVAYHGLLLDADLKEIKFDVPLIAAMQTSLMERLLAEAEPKVQSEIKLLRLEAEENGFGTEDMVLANNGILGSLLEQSAEKLRARYDWRYRMVRAQSWQIIDISIRPEVLEWLRNNGLDTGGIPAEGNPAAYVAQCRAESVPTPPEFPSEHWIDGGPLERRFDFLYGDSTVHVHTYTSGDGVCYALPRPDRGLLGIICQSQRTGKACFYDNMRATGGNRIDWTRDTMSAWEVRNGNDLGEVCTDCHRGGNAFIIHPGSALQQPGVNTEPRVRYTPIGSSSFVNPGPLALPALNDPESQGSCEECHEIPQLTPEYCRILTRAAATTMPPYGPPAGWLPADTQPYYLHLAFLSVRCAF